MEPNPNEGRWYLADAAATERVGAAVARALSGGMVVTLAGDLGTGKTTLVRGLLREAGWTAPVKSPTYTLVEYYPLSSLYLYHFDFYRFADPEEWETAGLAEYFRHDSACIVEWPERVRGVLPLPDLSIVLAHAGDGRDLHAASHSPAGDRCLDAMKRLATSAPR
jgi:tRNA threonylcarbamoyladenosine biosynthesis protein TsaE